MTFLAAKSGEAFSVLPSSRELGTSWQTLNDYLNAFQSAGVLDAVPGWNRENFDKTAKSSKFVMADSSLMAYLLGISTPETFCAPVLGSKDSGRLANLAHAWVYSQLAAEADLTPQYEIFHFLSQSHHADFLIADGAESFVGIKVKATESVCQTDFKHLNWLARKLNRSFRGIVLYAGDEILPFGQNMTALPLSALLHN